MQTAIGQFDSLECSCPPYRLLRISFSAVILWRSVCPACRPPLTALATAGVVRLPRLSSPVDSCGETRGEASSASRKSASSSAGASSGEGAGTFFPGFFAAVSLGLADLPGSSSLPEVEYSRLMLTIPVMQWLKSLT